MKIIDFNMIKDLRINPLQCVDWVRDAFCAKYQSILPPKISIKLQNDVFFNTMPAYIPSENRFGVKIVSRYPERKPSLKSDFLLYCAKTGEPLALMDASWITAMRTGAVATLAIQTLKSEYSKVYSFMGLGNTARATLLCLLNVLGDQPIEVRLLAYKKQELDFIERFRNYNNVQFVIVKSISEWAEGADVIVSCVTAANELLVPDQYFKKGVLVVPVHTRGFQNCDLFFDKVFADDTAHVCGFKYFDKFHCYDELSNVLLNKSVGRANDCERILAYNIGIALHDVYFASKIYDLIGKKTEDLNLFDENNKFWI